MIVTNSVFLTWNYPKLAVIIILIIISITACNKKSNRETSEAGETEKIGQSNTSQSEDQLKNMRSTIKLEELGDRSSFDKPRLLFFWKKTHEDPEELWSVKIDGTDFRLVLGVDDLYSVSQGAINHPAIRSPNNRYIVIKMGKENVLFDLRNRTSKVIGKGWGKPQFAWDSNSQYIYMALDGDFVRFSLESQETIQLGFPPMKAFFLINEGKNVFSPAYHGFVVYDMKGNEVDVYKNNEIKAKSPYEVSQDGRYYFYQSGYYYVMDTESKEFYKLPREYGLERGKFGPANKYMYYALNELYRYDFKTKTKALVLKPIGGSTVSSNVSIYNLR